VEAISQMNQFEKINVNRLLGRLLNDSFPPNNISETRGRVESVPGWLGESLAIIPSRVNKITGSPAS